MADWDDDLDDFLGRYEVHEANGRTLKLDTCTGQAWVLRDADSKPVWVPISAVGGKA